MSGLKSYASCSFGTTSPTISIVLDYDLTFQLSEHLIELQFPKIKNFNADLRSSPIKIKTVYDKIVLDGYGTGEENRIMTTTGVSKVIAINSFDYFP